MKGQHVHLHLLNELLTNKVAFSYELLKRYLHNDDDDGLLSKSQFNQFYWAIINKDEYFSQRKTSPQSSG